MIRIMVKYVVVYYDKQQVAKINSDDLIGFDGRISSLPQEIFPDVYDENKASIDYVIDLDQCQMITYEKNHKVKMAPYIPYCILPKNRSGHKNISFNGYGGLVQYKIQSYNIYGFKTFFKSKTITVVTDKLDGFEVKDIFQTKKLVWY